MSAILFDAVTLRIGLVVVLMIAAAWGVGHVTVDQGR